MYAIYSTINMRSKQQYASCTSKQCTLSYYSDSNVYDPWVIYILTCFLPLVHVHGSITVDIGSHRFYLFNGVVSGEEVGRTLYEWPVVVGGLLVYSNLLHVRVLQRGQPLLARWRHSVP